MVTTLSSLQPEKLPPTVQAIRYHSMRVQLQVCQWKYLDLTILDARNWGWKGQHQSGCLKLLDVVVACPRKTRAEQQNFHAEKSV